MINVADAAERETALDPSRSFIVQAPAGSGKTGLLTQRYLRLLATVDAPEEIIAITFTRKAAAEMRERVLTALRSAEFDDEPQSDHEHKTWTLAKKALAQDEKLDWSLLGNPNRLRIQTIDSLCMELARQMPLLTQFGAVPGLVENAQHLYAQAASTVLSELESDHDISDSLTLLLQHRDNRLGDVQKLIAHMLSKRDQWLRHIVNHQSLQREQIEAVLQQLISESLQALKTLVPRSVHSELAGLACFAASNLTDDAELAVCRDLTALPDAECSQLFIWNALSSLLLTNDGKLRKTVTKTIGFPAASDAASKEDKAIFKAMKQRMTELLKGLTEHSAFITQLASLKKLPSPQYSDEEWEVIDALFKILLRSVAHLSVVFSEQGDVDFTEMALRAKLALGDEGAPTDLALQLDYQIKHLLVDEFQDTSQNQFDLFKQLTLGWEQDDGRSLFLVGDPMQSIYRFREAEVGLFIDAWLGSLGDVRLTPLQLKVNFRSQQGIIDWVNEKFPSIMPAENNKRTGAVCYAPSESFKSQEEGLAVVIHPYLHRDDEAEAKQVLSIIQAAAEEHPQGTTAILIRSKSHLLEIIQLLKKSEIRFQAVEIDRLSQRSVVQDLLSLTRAMFHLGDRIAWLALLRAPFVGLDLADLHQLTGDDRSAQQATVLSLLHDETRLASMSDVAQIRLQRVVPSIDAALAEKERRGLRDWLEGLWIKLGGVACVLDDNDSDDAEAFFQLLEALEQEENYSIEKLTQRVEALFAQPDVGAGDAVQLMTIYKAKGLEFDTVIVPGLGRQPRSDESQLLYWQESIGEQHHTDLVFGPIQSATKQANQTADYIKSLDAAKTPLENARLLYVAATRAKIRLHLLGHATIDKKQLIKPAASSLLKQLWPAVAGEFNSALEQEKETSESEDKTDDVLNSDGGFVFSPRSRLTALWQCPPSADNILLKEHEVNSGEVIEFDWAGETARCVGIVVHRFLQYIASANSMSEIKLKGFPAVAKQMLYKEGVAIEQIGLAVDRVMLAINNTIDDERGRWIVINDHQQASCELPITAIIDDEIRHMIIDRTFIDEQGTRWVIDYKTGHHEGSDVEDFLDSEQTRYQPQLQRYADALQKTQTNPVRMGLYYPTMRGWREWD